MIALARKTAWDRQSSPVYSIVPAVLFVVISLPVLYNYIPWLSANFLIGCITLPLLVRARVIRPSSRRYLWAAAFFCVVYCLLPVKTCLYVALCAALLGIYECRYGKVSLLAPITLLLMSPVAQNFGDNFSFPIRLQLTKIAGSLLAAGGVNSTVAGNVITCNGADFSVDPACMGLHMLLTSLLCTLLIIALQQQRTGKHLSLGHTILLLFLAILLNLLANLIRIVLLVHFHLLPASPMHEIMGIACLIIYVLLPIAVLVKWLLRRRKIYKVTEIKDVAMQSNSNRLQSGLLLLMTIVVVAMKQPPPNINAALPKMTGYATSWYDKDIARLQNEHSLVYLKRLRGFYFSEHNPMLCWVGSGYTFGQVEQRNIAGIAVCTGMLQKGPGHLYTAWWYDNGSYQTANANWRLKALRGASEFTLVNVTATDTGTLHQEIQHLSQDQQLRTWLGNK